MMRKTVQRRRAGCWIVAAGVLLAAASIARAQEPPKNLVINESPRPLGSLRFEDAEGQARSLADFHGKMVLLNIWATWCTPCRKELPALAHLGAALDNAEFAVLAVSIDHGGAEAVRKLFGALSIDTLPLYVDSSGHALQSARVYGLPTSLIIDRDGREVARIVGPAAWDAAETVAYFRHVVARKESGGDRPSDHGEMTGEAKLPTPRALRVSREKPL
jgi:thiol-disulfide isomerase/thioredoxin